MPWGKVLPPSSHPEWRPSPLPLCFMSQIQSPVLSPSVGPALRGGGDSSATGRRQCVYNARLQGPRARVLFSWGPGRAGKLLPVLPLPLRLQRPPAPSPPFSPGKTVTLPSKGGSPTGCLGKKPFTFSAQYPLSACPLPKEAAIFLPRGLGKYGTQLRWERGPGSTTADCGPSCVWRSLLRLAYLPTLSLSATYCTVSTRRDQGVSLYPFQGTLLPGKPDMALGAWSLLSISHKPSISGLGGMGSLDYRARRKEGACALLTSEPMEKERKEPSS